MVFDIFKSLFSNDSNKTAKSNNSEELIYTLNQIISSGDYTSSYLSEENSKIKNQEAQEMLSSITDIEEKSALLNDSNLFYSLALAYRNYCAWYVRGDERKRYLEKCVDLLNQSISIEPDNISAKSELGHLLIAEKVIRNLSKGIKILESLKSEGNMPSYLNSTLSKAHRQSGDLEQTGKFNLCAFIDPSPAVFAEERKRFRALIRKYKKQNETEKIEETLNQYYNLAVLVTACYGDHDCNSGVSGWQYDKAVTTVKKICNKINFSFVSHGHIENSNFISKNDWKIFVRVFGDCSKSFNPIKELKIY